MLAEEDAIDAWSTPNSPSPHLVGPSHVPLSGGDPNGLVSVSSSDETRRQSQRGAKKRPSRIDRAAPPAAAADTYPAAAPPTAAVPTAGTLPAVRGSMASTVGPFSPTPPVPSAASRKNTTVSAATKKSTKKPAGPSTSRASSSSRPAAKKNSTTAAASAAAAGKKEKTATKGAGKAASVRSGSTTTSKVKAKKAPASRTSSAAAKSTSSTSKAKKKTPATKTKAGSISGSSKASSGRKPSAKAGSKTKKTAKAGSIASSTGKKTATKKTNRAGSSVASSAAGSKATSKKKKGSTTVVRRGAPMRKARGSSRASTSRSSLRSSLKSKGGKRTGSGGKRRQTAKINVMSLLEAVVEQEVDSRSTLEVEEEMERDGLQPVYNVLVMELVRTQVQQLNSRQRQFTETMELLKERGLQRSAIEGADSAEAIIDLLRAKMEGEAMQELQQLRADNASLRERLEERTLDLDKKSSAMELLRTQLARQLTHREAENDALRAEVHSSLQSATLNVERMKKDLGHRIDIACSTFRTPKYDTAMRAMQELVAEVQSEVQEHHDTLSKLILSIGAKDTFAKEEGDSMHTNLPGKYRASLRALEKDNILNILDVLSFQEGVVATVGKALYVLEETGHKTNVM